MADETPEVPKEKGATIVVPKTKVFGAARAELLVTLAKLDAHSPGVPHPVNKKARDWVAKAAELRLALEEAVKLGEVELSDEYHKDGPFARITPRGVASARKLGDVDG